MRAGRNFLASARIAFALMAPALACTPSPRAPVSESCIPPHATVQEARTVVEGAVERIRELHGTLLERFKDVRLRAEGLEQGATSSESLRYVLDSVMPVVEGILRSLEERSESLEARAREAGENVERMRNAARIACAIQEFAERNSESGIGLLEMASAEIEAAGKETE